MDDDIELSANEVVVHSIEQRILPYYCERKHGFRLAWKRVTTTQIVFGIDEMKWYFVWHTFNLCTKCYRALSPVVGQEIKEKP